MIYLEYHMNNTMNCKWRKIFFFERKNATKINTLSKLGSYQVPISSRISCTLPEVHLHHLYQSHSVHHNKVHKMQIVLLLFRVLSILVQVPNRFCSLRDRGWTCSRLQRWRSATQFDVGWMNDGRFFMCVNDWWMKNGWMIVKSNEGLNELLNKEIGLMFNDLSMNNV